MAVGQRRQPKPPKGRTIPLKDFTGGVNLTDSRTAIKDNECSWLENVMPIGQGALQLFNGPGAAIHTDALGISSVWGVTLSGSPYLIVVGTNGSLTQVTPGGVATVIAGAGAVSGQAGLVHFTVWQGTTLLILDPNTGYASWDGMTYTVIDTTQTGTAIAVFQGRAWLISGRRINFTAPLSFSNFAVGDGAGTTIISDEAFPGNINAAVSAFEQLWLVGDGAVEIISNVVSVGTSPSVITTFSITSVVSNLGSNAQHSVIGYLRGLFFLSPFGAYGLSGVTPQKITEKLDGLFPDLTISHSQVSSAVAIVENILCLIYRVQYNGQQSIQGPGPLLMIFANGRWFFSSQGDAMWITSLLVNGVPTAWATDGMTVYQMFAAADATPIAYKAQWKLSDFGQATTGKRTAKTGFEFEAAYSVAPSMVLENETTDTEAQGLETTVPIQFVNNAGEPLDFVNNSGEALTFVAQGRVLSRQSSYFYGSYIGWTVSGTDPKYRIQAIQLEIEEGPKWVTPATTIPRA